jgi:predicted flap endonuclease-1-like 5' DNA nuclease
MSRDVALRQFALPVNASAAVLFWQASEGGSGIPWWFWLGLISALLLLLVIGLVRRSGPVEPLPRPERGVAETVVVAEQTAKEPMSEQEPGVEEVAAVALASESEATEGEPTELGEEAGRPQPDDLKRIDGIGPKIASILNENGIITFADLAAMETGYLQQLLNEAGIRMAHPGTWPEQAELAAAGQWLELENMQSNLKGGRRK